VRVEGQLVLNGTVQVLNAALAGFGFAYVPENLAQPHLAQGRLKRVFGGLVPAFSGIPPLLPEPPPLLTGIRIAGRCVALRALARRISFQ
jgi:DNA-binding transcriptional LysR family regulator